MHLMNQLLIYNKNSQTCPKMTHKVLSIKYGKKQFHAIIIVHLEICSRMFIRIHHNPKKKSHFVDNLFQILTLTLSNTTRKKKYLGPCSRTRIQNQGKKATAHQTLTNTKHFAE